MKRLIYLAIGLLLAAHSMIALPASAASPKAGALCTANNSLTKIAGKNFVCAVKPAEWNKSHKLYWQELSSYSSAVDSLLAKLNPTQRYQYCLIQSGGPLPGESGKVPQKAIDSCAKFDTGSKTTSTTIVQPSGAPVTTAPWDPSVTLKYLACLKENGFEPNSTADLVKAKDMGTQTQKTALTNCKADQPFYLNR